VHIGTRPKKKEKEAKTANVTFKRWNGPLPALQKSFMQKAIVLDNKQCSGKIEL
jgi:hypothetical protein